MADVKVGQVRRAAPTWRRARGFYTQGLMTYARKPFKVTDLRAGEAMIVNLYGRACPRWRLLAEVKDAPLWPSEHEQWKDARGYEVKT